jgi:hypothetical protein
MRRVKRMEKHGYSMMIRIHGMTPGMAGFFIAVALFLTLLSGTARSQHPGHRIGVNPAYPVPAKETPAGIEVNSSTLVENAILWNGRIIAFKGEAIGECMVRRNMAWLHLNDDAYMEKNIEEGAVLGGYNGGHAVWVSAELAKKIRFFGDFKHDGDIVRVMGAFNAACREHGGDMDIHATSLEIIRPGHLVRHMVNMQRGLIAVLLFVNATLLYGIRRIAVRRRI